MVADVDAVTSAELKGVFCPNPPPHVRLFLTAGGRKPKMHQPASNGSYDLGIKKRPREGKGLLLKAGVEPAVRMDRDQL